MTAPMMVDLAGVRNAVQSGLPVTHIEAVALLDENDRLRARLTSRRDPIGYVVFRQYPSGYVAHSSAFVATTLEIARGVQATRKKGCWADLVCALVPVPDEVAA